MTILNPSWLKNLEDSVLVQECFKIADYFSNKLKDRLPQLHELGSQFIQGQKEAFHVLFQPASALTDSNDLDKTQSPSF